MTSTGLLIWTVLALNTNTGDFSLTGIHGTQSHCIKTISDTVAPDFPAATIYQCVRISKVAYDNYVRDTHDWARISSTTKKH